VHEQLKAECCDNIDEPHPPPINWHQLLHYNKSLFYSFFPTADYVRISQLKQVTFIKLPQARQAHHEGGEGLRRKIIVCK
jgi:hypothetical protein